MLFSALDLCSFEPPSLAAFCNFTLCRLFGTCTEISLFLLLESCDENSVVAFHESSQHVVCGFPQNQNESHARLSGNTMNQITTSQTSIAAALYSTAMCL
jgi:hypothetical protein